ncbi:MAG: diacylglycerol kinase family lipid kinase [Actinobacteria bacterium]|nr:diacylglycerol kinase family lipid kinase [Actinomycetota bacterium]MBW3647707.1 diacylglycerol kinase family lipid kinase [Actinomycetota bacterium]
MRVLLLVNPKATTTSADARDALAKALASQTELEIVVTERRDHATDLARQAVLDGLDVIVALGGDGTVNEVVNGLLADGPRAGLPALAVVPGGSTNVFARALGLPRSMVEATSRLLDALHADRRRTVGLGMADNRWFTFCAGLGLDAEVVRRVEGKRSEGHKATPGLFVRQGLSQFYLHTDRRTMPMTVHTAAGPIDRVGLALVCNSDPWTYLGGRPVRPCPTASFDTGLDLFALRRLGTVDTLRNLRQVLSDRPQPVGGAALSLCDQTGFTLSADAPMAFQLDGDDLGDRTRVEFRSMPRALDVVI